MKVPEITYIQQTILDCVQNLDGQLQPSEAAKLLGGSKSARMASEIKEGKFFGRLSRVTVKSLRHHVNVLIQQKYLEQDGFGRVLLAERGREFFAKRQ